MYIRDSISKFIIISLGSKLQIKFYNSMTDLNFPKKKKCKDKH